MVNLKNLDFKKKLIVIISVSALIWTYLIFTYSAQLMSLPHNLQFFYITALSYVFPSIILGFFIKNGGLNFSAIKKIAGSFFFISGFDLIIPPLLVSLNGVINSSPFLAGASIDVFVAEFWQGLGFSGGLLFYLTYPITFVLLIFLGAFFLTQKEITSILKRV